MLTAAAGVTELLLAGRSLTEMAGSDVDEQEFDPAFDLKGLGTYPGEAEGSVGDRSDRHGGQ